MPINKFLYFGDFLAIPVAVTVLTYSALAAGGLWAAPDFGVSLLIGLATWTLVEYAIHRFVYHHAPLFSALHDSHHQAPNEFMATVDDQGETTGFELATMVALASLKTWKSSAIPAIAAMWRVERRSSLPSDKAQGMSGAIRKSASAASAAIPTTASSPISRRATGSDPRLWLKSAHRSGPKPKPLRPHQIPC